MPTPLSLTDTKTFSPRSVVSTVIIESGSLNKKWEPFYNTDSSRGKDKKGTGLGLSIVKESIQAHGENINVISTEGVGSEFTFTLPKSKDSAHWS